MTISSKYSHIWSRLEALNSHQRHVKTINYSNNRRTIVYECSHLRQPLKCVCSPATFVTWFSGCARRFIWRRLLFFYDCSGKLWGLPWTFPLRLHSIILSLDQHSRKGISESSRWYIWREKPVLNGRARGSAGGRPESTDFLFGNNKQFE